MRADGYGQLWLMDENGSRCRPAQRISWIVNVGPIPDGMWVLHHCDNRVCVRPSHLFLGTAADNTADMVAKGRCGGPGKGEAHPLAKITAAIALDIRARKAGGQRAAQIARDLGLSQLLVGKVIRRERWKHI